MSSPSKDELTWEIATNVEEVHSLLCVSDEYNSILKCDIPKRNILTTKYFVENKFVEFLRYKREPLAMYTLLLIPPFEIDLSIFQEANKAAYLCRLCINPKYINKHFLSGIQCVRRAIDRAIEMECDYIRCEINPDLINIKKMLEILEFSQCGEVIVKDGAKKMYMQKNICKSGNTNN